MGDALALSTCAALRGLLVLGLVVLGLVVLLLLVDLVLALGFTPRLVLEVVLAKHVSVREKVCWSMFPFARVHTQFYTSSLHLMSRAIVGLEEF